MFRKLSAKLKKGGSDGDRRNSAPSIPPGGAVPYRDLNGGSKSRRKSSPNYASSTPNGATPPGSQPRSSASAEPFDVTEAHLLCEAAAKGDIDGVKQLRRSGIDVNATNEYGNTALHGAATTGQTKALRYLLVHGAEIEAKNKLGQTPLYIAVQNGHTGAVGVLLDYIHSVDARYREPYVLLRAKREIDGSYFVEQVRECTALSPYKERGISEVQILITHGQGGEDMAIFLYSVLDVEVTHCFFMNVWGDLNMKNFQRFEAKSKTKSITVLNSFVKVIEISGYEKLKSLILVACAIHKMVLDGLVSVELIDVRYNNIEELPASIRYCQNLKSLKCSNNYIKKLPRELGFLEKNLQYFDCSFNQLKRLTSHLVKCKGLKTLECNNNGLIELPVDIGLLSEVEELYVQFNKLSHLPLSISSLSKLKRIKFHSNPLQNIPVDFPQKSEEVKEYLKALEDDPVPNKTVKLVLVGQEGVGKSTLLKALKRTLWVLPKTPNIPKTDGIDVKDIKMGDTTLRCFDCGGDVDFNETHNFFITQGALYLACFNLSEYCLSTVERSSFLLGRLQLWMQYIFSKAPNAQVIIVGTHADHEALKQPVLQEIWDQLRTLLVNAREFHHQYFSQKDRLHDCLLCQPDSKCLRCQVGSSKAGFVNMAFDASTSNEEETSFNGNDARAVSLPHIVGYYEISSIKSVGSTSLLQVNTNPSIDNLKDAIKDNCRRLIQNNPEIPSKWANAQESLHNHISMNPNDCVVTIDEIAKMAKVQGVQSKADLINMLHFLKAQGNVLYFPQLDNLKNLVILDPEWLAKIFSSVLSFRDTGISNEGFIGKEVLKERWSHVEPEMRDRVLTLLHHFGLCLPVKGTDMELFPCRLPIGEPDESNWPRMPNDEYQLTYSVTFASLIPPPFFSDLISTIYRIRTIPFTPKEDTSRYLANHIVDHISLDTVGCAVCEENVFKHGRDKKMLTHLVHFELIPHKKTIHVAARGQFPCCMIQRAKKILNKVAENFEGLGTIEFDSLICPGCCMQKSKKPHVFSAKSLLEQPQDVVACNNAHILGDSKSLLKGVVHNSCLPAATIKPKQMAEMKEDFSGCPKLFVVLPVNKDGISFDTDLKLFVSSLLLDGYAAHFACEFPDGYHLTNTPGYRLKRPKEFMKVYGGHVLGVLRLMSYMASSTVVSSQYSNHTKAICRTIKDLLKDFQTKFAGFKDLTKAPEAQPEQLVAEVNQRGNMFKREDLRQHLNIFDTPNKFGPLHRLKYEDQLMWLCDDHYKQMRVVSLGTIRPGHVHVESFA